MSILSSRLATASRRYEDVDVLLNGALVSERDQLLARMATPTPAQPQRQGDSEEPKRADPDARLTYTAPADQARADYEAFIERIREEIVTVRVVEPSRTQWRKAQLDNPIDAEDASALDRGVGFNLTGAAIDLLTETALVCNPDGDPEKPTPDEWAEFFQHVNAGDLARLVDAVCDVAQAQGMQGYDFARKG